MAAPKVHQSKPSPTGSIFTETGVRSRRPPKWNRRNFLNQCGRCVAVGAGIGAGISPKALSAATIPAPEGRWIRETIRRETDPVSGAEIWQLTSAAAISHDIYGEQLYCSADGTRIAFLRLATSDYRDGPQELFVADLNQNGVKRLGAAPYFYVAGNGRQDAIFYVRQNDEEKMTITRVNFSTLEQKDIFTFDKCPPPEFRGLLAVSPDEKYCMILRRMSQRGYGIERIDLEKGSWELIHEQDDIFNGHLQFNPAGGDLMVQHNRGGMLDDGTGVKRARPVGPEGATLYVIDENGENLRRVPVGSPHTVPISGHESWVGETGKLLLTTRGGKIYLATPGEKEPQLIAIGSGFMHITASPDGRFFVVDSIGTGKLFLGCIATRKVLPLCDSGASGGFPQYTHTHPYITPGNHRVIYNSDRTGITQVYAARIPEAMLEQLETK